MRKELGLYKLVWEGSVLCFPHLLKKKVCHEFHPYISSFLLLNYSDSTPFPSYHLLPLFFPSFSAISTFFSCSCSCSCSCSRSCSCSCSNSSSTLSGDSLTDCAGLVLCLSQLWDRSRGHYLLQQSIFAVRTNVTH